MAEIDDLVQLKPDECRVLGTLIEKAQTTPAQYPLTLVALVSGCSQKNNREPVIEFDEDRILTAVDGLRGKGLVREVMLSGSRVAKYRHVAREALGVTTEELVLLAELLMRGPQSVGELRGHASRMHPIDSLDACQGTLDGLMRSGTAYPPVKPGEVPRTSLRPAMIRELPPAPGTRATRFVQLLCPALHPLNAAAPSAGTAATMSPTDISEVLARLEKLERDVADLREQMRSLL